MFVNYKGAFELTWLIDDFRTLALTISAYITQAVQFLVSAIYYPIISFLTWVSNTVILIFNTLVALFDTLWSIFSAVYSMISVVLFSFFPAEWVGLILVGVTITFGFRLYFFIRGS